MLNGKTDYSKKLHLSAFKETLEEEKCDINSIDSIFRFFVSVILRNGDVQIVFQKYGNKNTSSESHADFLAIVLERDPKLPYDGLYSSPPDGYSLLSCILKREKGYSFVVGRRIIMKHGNKEHDHPQEKNTNYPRHTQQRLAEIL